MPDAITVANSSCLIALQAIGHLDIIFAVYGEIDIPEAVNQECGGALPSWIRVQPVRNQALVLSLRSDLGAGESEAIALSLELNASRLILDDKKARRIARQLSSPVVGTLAILLSAKSQGVIPTVKDVITALRDAGFRMSDNLRNEALKRAGE
jgi:predicted nucleic acid-binding protein